MTNTIKSTFLGSESNLFVPHLASVTYLEQGKLGLYRGALIDAQGERWH